MLTVDEIRRELEKTNVLIKKITPEQEDLTMEEKRCKHHPDRPARIAATGRSLGLCQECFQAAREKGAVHRTGKTYKTAAAQRPEKKLGSISPKPAQPVSTRLKSAKVGLLSARITAAPRLILAETFVCPKCGVQLMFGE